MGLLDIILLVIIGGFTMLGFWFGVVHTFGSLIGTLAGIFLASRFYEPMAQILVNITGWSENTSRIVMFIIAFVLINRLVGFGFWIFEKTSNIIARMPFLKGINRFLGLALGLFEGIITVGIILYFIEVFPVSPNTITAIEDSPVALFAIATASVFLPLVPDALKSVEHGFEAFEGTL